MEFEAAQRVRDGLAELIRLVNSGNASTADARRVLDPVAGAKLRTRLLKEAERLRRSDLGKPDGEKRTLPQRSVRGSPTSKPNLSSRSARAEMHGRDEAEVA